MDTYALTCTERIQDGVGQTLTLQDTLTLEDLRKENEYLRAEVAYLKKLGALVRAKKQVAPKKRKLSSN